MAIRFLPSKLLRKIAPAKTVKKLVSRDLTLNRAAVTMLTKSGVLTKKKLETVAIKVIKGYRQSYGDERKAGASVAKAFEEAVNDKSLMVARVQNTVIFEIANEIKDVYHGEFYEWLPSDAENPDPIHQLNYGKTFQLGVGDENGQDPGDRYGCRCGMNILVPETVLSL